MKYSSYGLDDDKRSEDPPVKPGRCWCLWCNAFLERGFSMCFQNWSICPRCVADALAGNKSWRWAERAWCVKCLKHHQRAWSSSPEIATTIHLCEDCLTWAADALKLNSHADPQT